jgi:hypothetical protein
MGGVQGWCPTQPAKRNTAYASLDIGTAPWYRWMVFRDARPRMLKDKKPDIKKLIEDKRFCDDLGEPTLEDCP